MIAVTQEDIAKAGVVGAGGAGFPTHVKLSGKADTVVLNGAECEPLLHKDKELILSDAELIAEGLSRAMNLVGAREGVVAIKSKYSSVVSAMSKALRPNMRVALLPDIYPSGDEFVLVYLTLGRIIPPGAIPLAVGAVVMNIETARNVANVGRTPVVDKYLSIAGAVLKPCTVKVPIGTSLRSCLELAGGATVSNPSFILGGVMMGKLVPNIDIPITKTTGGLIVLPEDHFVVQRKKWDWKKTQRLGKSACDQCARCTELCPRYLLGHPIEPHRSMRNLGFNSSEDLNVLGSLFCSECNLCSYSSCPEGLDPRGVNRQNKINLAQKKTRWDNPTFRPERTDALFEFRKTPTKRLMQRVGLGKFQNIGPLLEHELHPQEVKILLRQHIGAPCTPIVKSGDRVKRGQTIAVRPNVDGKVALGADISASIDGVVSVIDSEQITIQSSDKIGVADNTQI